MTLEELAEIVFDLQRRVEQIEAALALDESAATLRDARTSFLVKVRERKR